MVEQEEVLEVVLVEVVAAAVEEVELVVVLVMEEDLELEEV